MKTGISFWQVFVCILYIYFIASYVGNLIKLFNCDFDNPWKEEIIHLIGLLFPPLAGVTVWF